MTRILTFDGPKAEQRFQLLRTALFAVSDGKSERPAAQIRKEARLQDAFDTISESQPTATDADARVLVNHGPQTLTISQEDFDLLLQYTEKTPWLPRVSRQVVDLWDWLSTAERKD
jgi:hypothetical protein